MTNSEAIAFAYEQLEIFGGDMAKFLKKSIQALAQMEGTGPRHVIVKRAGSPERYDAVFDESRMMLFVHGIDAGLAKALKYTWEEE